MSTELLHQPRAICRNISLGFKARLLCKQKALQPPPERVAQCAEVADALSDPSGCFTQCRTGTPQAHIWALPFRPSAQGMAQLLAWHPQGKDRGCGQKKIIVNHGNCFIKEGFFLLQGKVGKKSEMGKKGQAINGAGSNSAI